jgi:hypothetical protein
VRLDADPLHAVHHYQRAVAQPCRSAHLHHQSAPISIAIQCASAGDLVRGE